MFKKIIALLSVLIYLSICFNAYAMENIKISAQCAVVYDCLTQDLLFQKNPYLRRSMASTTKIMTCLIACESNRLDETVTVNEEALINAEGTSINLKAGDRITLIDLVKGAMLESGNDAANAIACFLCGSISEFTVLMNQRAKELGMNNTSFATPSGLDSAEHYSCAYDMALLGAKAAENEALLSISSVKTDYITINGNKNQIKNHNKLLSVSNCFKGLKTGFTKKSGRCLVSVYNYEGNRIVCVTLNAYDDWNDHIKLINGVKKNYIRQSDYVVLRLPTLSSDKATLSCCYSYDVKACKNIDINLYYYPIIYYPVMKNEVIGKAVLSVNNKVIKAENIIAQEEI